MTGFKLSTGAATNSVLTSDASGNGTWQPLTSLNVWNLTGNSGTNGSQFLGTTDNQPLVVKVNNRRAMRYSYAEDTATVGQEFRSINVLGGSQINSISNGKGPIIVVPALLAAATHAKNDMPSQVQALRQQFPGEDIRFAAAMDLHTLLLKLCQQRGNCFAMNRRKSTG